MIATGSFNGKISSCAATSVQCNGIEIVDTFQGKLLREAFKKKKSVKRMTLSLLGLEPTYPT